MKLRVTLVQQALVWHEPQANRERFDALLTPLAGSTDLIVLPEMFPTGFSMEAERLAEPVGGPSTRWLESLSENLDAAVTGSIITEEGGRYYNRMLWVTPGEKPQHYDKRHLFRMAREHNHYTPGRAAITVSWRGVEICPLVCYDLRFPVFSRRRPGLEYELLVYAANWPSPRHHAWLTLLKARAIENQAYVVGVNRSGKDGNGIDYSGGSGAYDFLGQPLVAMGSDAQVATVTLDTEPLRAFRERFPAHLDADQFTLEL
jgi:predicted amidohydrolase